MLLQENRDCPLKLWLKDFSPLVALIINVYSLIILRALTVNVYRYPRLMTQIYNKKARGMGNKGKFPFGK